MFEFDPVMEKAFSECVPFDEGEAAGSDNGQTVRRELRLIRQFLERRDPEVMACIDGYMDKYLDLVDLECRHYFAEGYRMGMAKVVQLSSNSRSSSDSPSCNARLTP